MDNSFLFTLFEDLDRQGPGSDACTTRMFDRLSPPEKAKILDIGCGAGMQTLALARHCRSCTITAIDIHQPFLDALQRKADEAGISDRITPLCASIDNHPFVRESFDLIWSEGSVFVIGFEKGLVYWNQFLRPGGSLALTEMVWFTDHPSKEVATFMQEGYPAMTTVPACEQIIWAAGYRLIDSFQLPDETWWKEFYDHSRKKCRESKTRLPATQTAWPFSILRERRSPCSGSILMNMVTRSSCSENLDEKVVAS
jgi:ubiquinone/menaquinone biosynthesis C-methylase UbiE